jgi:hypothetical protein
VVDVVAFGVKLVEAELFNRCPRGPRMTCAGLVKELEPDLVGEQTETVETITGCSSCCFGWSLEVAAFGSRGFGGSLRGRSERDRLRRIISAETRHRGDIARDGKAGEGGPLLLLAEVEGTDVGLYGPRDGSENDRERRFPLGSGSVSISLLDDFVLDSRFMSSDDGVDATALACCQARRSSHLRTSLPNVRSIDNSRILSFSFFRFCRS